MIGVPFVEPLQDAAWKAWRMKADKATSSLVVKFNAGEGYRIRVALYKEMRQLFLDAFGGKCAYCEAKIILTQYRGDVEHFRPKGRVTHADNRPVTVQLAGGGRGPHPGYPWLAYDWRNLLPACIACNRPGTTRQGKLVGKWERFPVERYRARAPGGEKREKPLLLHPAFDDPAEHLKIDAQTGVIYGTTDRGKTTVEIFDLNREGLPEKRRDVYVQVIAVAHMAAAGGSTELRRQWVELLEGHREGAQEYAAAGRLALADAPGIT
jgi:hypothetical protein